MSKDFVAAYVNANLSQDAAVYDSDRFLNLKADLDKIECSTHKGFSLGILSAILCAQRRADVVLPLFRDVARAESEEGIKSTFVTVRECITLVTAYVGMPACMPAITGLAGELRHLRISNVSNERRQNFDQYDWTTVGEGMRETLYGGVGNQEGLAMINDQWPDFSNYAYTAVFGYLYGSKVLELRESELIVVSSIIGQGATRQARIHAKVALKLGNSGPLLKGVVNAAADIATWNQNPLPVRIDIDECATELEKSLTA